VVVVGVVVVGVVVVGVVVVGVVVVGVVVVGLGGGGSATAGIIPPESVVNAIANPEASTTAAARQEQMRLDALIVAQLLTSLSGAAVPPTRPFSPPSPCSGGRAHLLLKQNWSGCFSSNSDMAAGQHLTRPNVAHSTHFSADLSAPMPACDAGNSRLRDAFAE
jgi:hypothetical protein